MTGSLAIRQLDVRIDDASVRCYVAGPLDAPVVVGHHGTPVTGLHQTAGFLHADARDICHVAIDRPGYGGSTRTEGRSVADVAPIVRAVLDELGVDRAAVYGNSGGGPHTLATAALLPERISRAVVMAGMAPVGRPDLDYFDTQTALMRDEMLAALEGPEASRDFLRRLEQENPGNAWTAVLTDGDLRVAGEVGAITESVIETLDAREASTRLEDGYVDDMQAFASPWGFALESIAVPVQLLQGTDDLMVPPVHAAWFRDHVPGASLQVLLGHGHLLQPFHADVFAWLTTPEGA